jgi:hypothetical protein
MDAELSVVIGIVGHPARKQRIDWLSKQVSPSVVELDTEGMGSGCNHLVVLTKLRDAVKSRDWAVVLEDDAIPVDDLEGALNRVLPHAPTAIVSLYNGTGYPQQRQREFGEAAASDTDWIIHGYLRHAVGYCIHADILCGDDLLRRVSQKVRSNWAADDAISSWARERHELVAYTNPSLVDHEDTESVLAQRTHRGRPVTGQRKRDRKAHNFGPPTLTIGDKCVSIEPL